MVTYGFYNAQLENDEPDRVYNANDLNTLFDGIIASGVFKTLYNSFNVRPTDPMGLSVIVDTGKAWLNNTWTINSAPITFSNISPVTGSGQSRIDLIYIKVDKTARVNSIEYRQGTQSSSPSKPTFSTNEFPIAYVTVVGGQEVITSSYIEIAVGKSREQGGTPYVLGLVDQNITVDELYTQWENSFETWFNDIKSSITGTDVDVIALKDEVDNMIKSGTEPLTSQTTLQNGRVYFQYEG